MNLESRVEGATVVVRIAGTVQLAEADELSAQLPGLMSTEATSLILDLSDLEFISSLGIAAFVKVHRTARERSGRVVIVNPRPPIANLLRITRVSELLPIFGSLEAARTAVGN